MNLEALLVDPIVRRALAEDLRSGDVTTSATIDLGRLARGQIKAKAPLVVAGLPVAERVFRCLEAGVRFDPLVSEGARVGADTHLATVEGHAAHLLSAERTALNFLQRMSGIATLTRCYVDATAGTKAKILDTRKTAPGLRLLDKYAVRIGGGQNHRFALDDMVLIKNNHITAAGGIREAVRRARAHIGPSLRVEVEAHTLSELEEALAAGADLIMLDNMETEAMREAARRSCGRAQLEASGNITLDRVAEVAATGVDFISVGELTHSPRAADIHMVTEIISLRTVPSRGIHD